MALLGANIASEVGLKLLLYPLGSNIVIRTACCSVGIVVPVYSTCRAIDRKDEAAQQKWLLYWAAYGSFSLVEIFSDKLISCLFTTHCYEIYRGQVKFARKDITSKCPYYYHMKFAFLVWLQLPSADGAKQLYMNHLCPFFLRHQAKVNRVLGLTYGELIKVISAHQGEIQYARAMILKVFGSDQMPRGRSSSDGPRNNAIEGEPRRITGSDSDPDD